LKLKAVLVALALVAASFVPPTPKAAADTPTLRCDTPTGQCNILLIETDDQSLDTLLDPATGEVRTSYQPWLSDQIRNEPGWYTFTQARAQDPMCGPSRWSQFTGLEAAHHRMTCNEIAPACATTGSPSYRSDRDRTYLAALAGVGYWNSYVGKFVNWYPCGWELKSKTYQVPAGVSDWHAVKGIGMAFDGGYTLIESTTGAAATARQVPKVPGDSDYGTYVLRDLTLSAINRCATTGKPCMFSYMPNAPHQPGTLPEDYDPSAVTPLPAHYPSYNEGCPKAVDPSLSDKPSFAQTYIKCFAGNTWSRNRMQGSLQAVDRSMAAIVQRLKDTGLYDSTVIVYTSDHGLSANENNRITKEVPYDSDMRVPLFVRVPGLPGGTIPALVSLVDITATLYDLAGTTSLLATDDSRSLLPLISGEAVTIRPEGMHASHLKPQIDPALRDIRPWRAWFQDCSVVAPDHCFVLIEYDNGERELYDLTADPYQLTNLLPNPTTGYQGVEGWDDTNTTVTRLQTALNEAKAE
jgi:arylsulfatase A-like enzyme